PHPIRDVLDRMTQMHARMTALVDKAVNDGTPVVVPLTNTLNEVTSSHASRLAALEDRLPTTIVGLLFVAGAIAVALMGAQAGHAQRSQIMGILGFILLLSLVVYVIMDLNQPSRGFIRVSQEPIQRLLDSMQPAAPATAGNLKSE